MKLNINNNWIKKFNSPFFICGPCSVDKKKYFFNTIKKLYNYNIKIFRAGIWKPRTFPNLFEGIGEKGLKWIKYIKNKYKNIYFAVEVANKKHIKLCIKYNIDILWIGARTTSNPFLMEKISKILKNTKKIILIKNTMHNEINLLFGAIQRLNLNNINNIGIIHRGCYNYNNNIDYRNFIEWNIYEKIKKFNSKIPIILDPSHIAGKKKYIYKIIKKSLIFNYQGYMIESHIKPSKALTDNLQQIKPKLINKYINFILKNKLKYLKKNNKLKIQRLKIEEIDKKILLSIYNRNKISLKIKKIKNKNNIKIHQKERFKILLNKYKKLAKKFKLSVKYILKIFNIIHKISINIQNK
ncbi:MAG: chorismate mutase [Candidatus Shikimatogenerans sp. Tcar]|uniref:chorismate mutase n=1 Tax=Candidatus Shikimatogenerans sp. Tcar TaxID=3158565 RepID=A0AAU7QSE8_9FLAO